MSAAIPEEVKVKIRSHMGYLNVQESMTFVLGVPAGVQTQFAIEGAMNRILPSALGELTGYIAKLDAVEQQIQDNMENLAAKKVGSIELNEKEFENLLTRYRYWQGKLANLLGCTPNPFDQRWSQWGGGGGINTNVIHS